MTGNERVIQDYEESECKRDMMSRISGQAENVTFARLKIQICVKIVSLNEEKYRSRAETAYL